MSSLAKNSWHQTIKDHKGNLTDIFRNPTARDLSSLFKAFGTLRADFEQSSGALLVWNAEFLTHSDVNTHYELASTFLYLKPEHIMCNDINHHTEEAGDIGYGEFLKNSMEIVFINEHLLNAYNGKLPLITGTDNANDEEHVLTLEFLQEVSEMKPDLLSDIREPLKAGTSFLM